MFKFIIPAIIVFLTILFWEKITNKIFEKFKIKLNYVLLGAILTIIVIIILLLKN